MANIKNFGLVGVGSDVQFGKSGPRLINNSGVFTFKNAGATALADIAAGNLNLTGNLQVNGTTTTVDSTTITTADKTFIMSNSSNDDSISDGSGFEVLGGDGTTQSAHTFLFDNQTTGKAFTSSDNMNLVAGKQYMIGGVPVLSSTTLGSSVVNSGLTSVGTLTSLHVSGTSALDGLVTAGAGVGVTGGLTTDTLTVTGLSTLADLTIGAGKTIDMGGNVVGNVAAGVAGTDAVNKSQLDAAIASGATAGLNALQTEVDTIETSVGLNNDGTFTAPTGTNYLGSITTVMGGLTALDSALKTAADASTSAVAAEATRAEGIEQAIIASVGLNTDGTLIAFTGTTVGSAESYLLAINALDAALASANAAIAAETSRATTAEGTLTTNLGAEVTRAEAAEAALGTRIDDLTTDQVAEGTTNLYFTAARARNSLSVDTTPANTGLLYNATTGVFGIDQTVLSTVTATQAGDASTLAAAKAYTDANVAGKTANAGQAAFAAFSFADTAKTVVSAITGFVHRVKVYVSTAFDDAAAGVQVGTVAGGTTVANALVSTADTDPTIAACYVVELAQPVSAADLVINVAGGASTVGAGYVVIEWI